MKPVTFPPRLRVAAVVKRWSIIWSHSPDTIASHTFMVQIYALLLARLIGWNVGNPRALYTLIVECIYHDLDETVSGDIVGVVKSHIIDARRYSDFVSSRMDATLASVVNLRAEARDEGREYIHEARRIIKAADRLDALLFMFTEVMTGNHIIGQRIQSGLKKLAESWEELPATQEMRDQVWSEHLEPSLQAHQDASYYDIIE